MTDIPRDTRVKIVSQFGPQLVDDARRVEGLLMDFCGEHRREINALVDAAHERVAVDLRDDPGRQPPALLIKNLTNRLLDNRPSRRRWRTGRTL